MSQATDQQMSHADRHDLDKLARWKSELDTAAGDGAESFPACAIFLVSPEDRASHDIFRRYRSAFEDMGGGFHHLVIFGQHGISKTLMAFLAELGMEQESVPLLAISPLPEMEAVTGSAYLLTLPKGEGEGELDESQSWGAVLERIRNAVSGQSSPSFDESAGVNIGAFRHGSLAGAVEGVLRELGEVA